VLELHSGGGDSDGDPAEWALEEIESGVREGYVSEAAVLESCPQAAPVGAGRR
jgi:hypothetical protein